MQQKESFFGTIRRFFRDYLTGIGTNSSFGKLVQKASKDQAFRDRLIKNPDAVLAESGIKLPQNMKIEILSNTDKVIHVVLPPLINSESNSAGDRK